MTFKLTKDPIVAAIIKRANDRSNAGIDSYGGTMADAKKSLHSWIDDAQEEAWDLIVYLEKIKSILPK
jgi:hypothetical protein|tara:strand:+ start:5896 stop:6099 length:204 start_codon:yes stop_codon:yes gene_type:complete